MQACERVPRGSTDGLPSLRQASITRKGFRMLDYSRAAGRKGRGGVKASLEKV